ncbi:TPA: ABC transporter ATP-binding protein [Streptococcus suis]
MHPNKGYKRLLMAFKPYRGPLVIVLIMSLVQVLLSLQIPVLIGRAINLVLGKGAVDFTGFFQILTLMLVYILLSTLVQIISPRLYQKIVLKVTSQLRQSLIDKIHVLPLSYLDRMATGDLVNTLVSDVEVLSDGILLIFNQFIIGMLTIFLTIFTMASLDLQMMILVVALTPLSIVFARFVASRSYTRFKDQSQARAQQVQLVEEAIQQLEVLRIFNGKAAKDQAFRDINQDYAVKSQAAIFISSITNPTTRFINAIIYATLTYLGALRIMAGTFTVGQLTTFLSFATQYTKPFNDISSVLSEIQGALASADRIYQILDQESPKDSAKAVLDPGQVQGHIDFEKVYFSYRPDQNLIEDLSLQVRAGQKVAIVGPTGAGKSTLINLLMRFYDLNQGAIKLDGVDISHYQKASVRQIFGMVLQETWLKAGTVHENIAYKNPQASRQQVIEAAKAAHAHHFIEQLPQGYDTYLEDGGASLSIGQQQLLSIARLFIDLPKVLILDEATSSIDTRTEVLIQAAFDRLMEGRTSFVIAHRLSTIQSADIILVMDQGDIVEMGNHQSLMTQRGLYYRMQMSRIGQD